MDLTLLNILDSLIRFYWKLTTKEHIRSLGIEITESENTLDFLKRLDSEECYVDLQTIGKSLLKFPSLQVAENMNDQIAGRLVRDLISDLKTLFKKENYELDDEIRQDSVFPIELKLHSKIIKASKSLYHNKHYSQAIFESIKILEKEIKSKSKTTDKIGVSLVNHVFNSENPLIKIVEGEELEHKDERDGFRFLFMGTFLGIKNPQSHSLQYLEDSAKA